ncbi:metallophosphoesterase family protein [Chloroflexota bacterium]
MKKFTTLFTVILFVSLILAMATGCQQQPEPTPAPTPTPTPEPVPPTEAPVLVLDLEPATTSETIQTPAPFVEPELRFGVVADVHNNPGALQVFVDAMNEWQPDFVIQLGDYGGKSASDYQALENVYRTTTSPRYHTIGNSDLDKELFLQYTESPGLYYSFDIKGFHIIVLDNVLPYMRAPQWAWFQQDLADSNQPTIIFMHVPIVPFWYDGHAYGEVMIKSDEARTLIKNDGDVIATFSGHNHPQHNKGDHWISLDDGVFHFNIMMGGNNFGKVSVYSNNMLKIEGEGNHSSYDTSIEATWENSVTMTNCETIEGWTGTLLSTDDVNRREGLYSVKDTISSPSVNATYATSYSHINPQGRINRLDFSRDGLNIDFWFKSSRASTDYTSVRLYLYDYNRNYRYQDLIFDADNWTHFRLLAADGTASKSPGYLWGVHTFTIEIKTADTDPYTINIDKFKID